MVIIVSVKSIIQASSKAFDKVNHWTLLNKLIKRKVPRLIVIIMLYWISKAGCVCIKYFPVTRGMRECGILAGGGGWSGWWVVGASQVIFSICGQTGK